MGASGTGSNETDAGLHDSPTPELRTYDTLESINIIVKLG